MIPFLRKYALLTGFGMSVFSAFGQEISDSLSITLYAEAYLGYMPNQPANGRRPLFFYNYVHNERTSLNLALARLHYSQRHFRTNIGIMAGDYAVNNLAGEAPWARYIYEANAGISLYKQALWLDAGIMPSHIGLESAIGMEQWAATRSIVADNSPYYETGIRLSYQPKDQWYFALLGLSGWQRITVPQGQQGMSWGAQVSWRPYQSWQINHSTFFGNVFTGQQKVKRGYSNFFTIASLHQHTEVAAGWDVGVQRQNVTMAPTQSWYALYALIRHRFAPTPWSATLRWEFFSDPQAIMITLPTNVKGQIHHLSVNIDREWLPSLLMRVEVNFMQSPQPVFFRDNRLVRSDWSFWGMLAYRFVHTK